MRYTICSGVYRGKYFNFDRAIQLISLLKKNGIDSNIIVGGVGVYPQNVREVHLLLSICDNFGVKVHRGLSILESGVMEFERR